MLTRSWRRTELAIVVAVLLFAAGFALAAAIGGGRQTLDIASRIPRALLPVLLLLSAVNYLMRGLRWLLFSHALRLNIPAAANLLYYVAGFAMTTTPGKMGEAVRLYLLNRFYGAPYDRTAALLVSDRLTDGLAATLVVSVTVGAFAHFRAGIAGALGVAAALIVLCLWPGLLLGPLHALYDRLQRWPRLFVRARRAVRALQRLADPRVFAGALILGAIGWTSEGVSFYLVLHALGVAITPAAAVFVFVFAMLVGAVSFLPGGLGSTEATMIGLLSLQGVPFETAVVATGIVRVTTLWFAVGLGLLALPLSLGGLGGARLHPKAAPVG